MKDRLKRYRTELLLALSLLLPLLLPEGVGLSGLASSPLSLLPTVTAGEEPAADEWRETAYRLMEENADLRARLFAIGRPLELVPLDSSFYERNPVRIEARVVARDASPWRGSVTISAGTREGVAPGQAAVVGRALVGVVESAARLTSRVRLLGDAGQRVWAEIAAHEGFRPGYVVGAGDDLLEMHLVRAGQGEPGDPVFTATGLAGVPRGLLVGTVQTIDDADRDGIAEVTVRPSVDPMSVRIVNVLARKRE